MNGVNATKHDGAWPYKINFKMGKLPSQTQVQKVSLSNVFFSPFTGLGGTYIKRSGAAEVRVHDFSNITLSCLVAEKALKIDDFQVKWNFKNQRNSLKAGGKYRIPELEPISSCRRAFKLEIINVTADDEGVYSCHQTCKDSYGDVCKSSAKFELKVYLPRPTKGKEVFNGFTKNCQSFLPLT